MVGTTVTNLLYERSACVRERRASVRERLAVASDLVATCAFCISNCGAVFDRARLAQSSAQDGASWAATIIRSASWQSHPAWSTNAIIDRARPAGSRGRLLRACYARSLRAFNLSCTVGGWCFFRDADEAGEHNRWRSVRVTLHVEEEAQSGRYRSTLLVLLSPSALLPGIPPLPRLIHVCDYVCLPPFASSRSEYTPRRRKMRHHRQLALCFPRRTIRQGQLLCTGTTAPIPPDDQTSPLGMALARLCPACSKSRPR
eukprot:2254819-Prymnesium_polylepis.1